MSEENWAERLLEILEEELKTREVWRIPKDLYRKAAGYVMELRGLAEQSKGSFVSMLAREEAQIVSTLLKALLSLRLEKAKGFRNSEPTLTNLTPEEKFLLEPKAAERRRVERVLKALEEGRPSVLEAVARRVKPGYMTVRFLKDAPAMVGVDLAKYGPFKAGDVAMIPSENAAPLVKQGLAEEVWAED